VNLGALFPRGMHKDIITQQSEQEYAPLPRHGKRDPLFGVTRSHIYQLEREGRLRLRRSKRAGRERGRTFYCVTELREVLK
jgi:hypothetical protein